MKRLALLAAIFPSLALAQAQVHDEVVSVPVGRDVLVVKAIGEDVLDIEYRPEGKAGKPSEMLDPAARFFDRGAAVESMSGGAHIRTTILDARIGDDGSVAVSEAGGQGLVKQDGVSASGARFETMVSHPQPPPLKTNHFEGWGALYGIRGYDLPREQLDPTIKISDGLVRNKGGIVAAGRQGDSGAPLIYSKNFGILVDSNGGRFDADADHITFSRSSQPSLHYFIIVGPPKKVMARVADLTGHPAMSPKWTLGFLNSQWKTDQKEVTDIIDSYRAKQIPIDCFIMDFDFKAWGEDHYGELRWNSTSNPGNVSPNKYPDGASGKFAKDMLAKGVKLVGIMKPRFVMKNQDGSLTEQAKAATDNGWWYPGREPYNDYFSGRPANDVDFSKPACRSWFWAHAKGLFDTGIRAWWNDEADEANGFFYDNWQFAHMQRSLYEGQRSVSNKRVWSINRNFYLGAQRYGYGEWSGDIDTGFEQMAEQPARMLSTIDCGECKWAMDTGGFNGHPDPENYARWMQFAAFVPIDRVHCTYGEHRQPWVYGPKAEAVAADAIRLRYSLLPYMYAYDRGAYETGIGIVRPMFWEFPNESTLANEVGQWMFGEHLLVAPVMDQGQTSKKIVLPAGQWFDYFRGTQYQGGQTVDYPLDATSWKDIPLFVREGAIIPSQPVQNFVGELPVDELTIDVFPSSSESSFDLYDDDGETYNYERGDFFKQQIRVRRSGSVVTVAFGQPKGRYRPSWKRFIVRVHGVSDSHAGEAGTDRFGPYTRVSLAAGRQVSLKIQP